MFLMSYSVNWPNFMIWLPLLLEILGNICNAIVCFPVCDDINFEINLIFLIKPILYITRKSRQKFSNWSKKTFFIIFKGLLADKYCLRLESAPLTIFAKRPIFDIWQGFGTLLVQVLSFRQRTDSLVYYQLSNYEKTYYTIESFGIKHSNIRTKLSFKFK